MKTIKQGIEANNITLGELPAKFNLGIKKQDTRLLATDKVANPAELERVLLKYKLQNLNESNVTYADPCLLNE